MSSRLVMFSHRFTGHLVELIYALYASGAINHGAVDLKEIQESLELIFKCKIDDLYRSFHEICNRKKEQVKFVNRLEECLVNRIDEVDGIGRCFDRKFLEIKVKK